MSAAGIDAIVVGGGPAGSAAATVLARHGRRVVLLERETGARYSVGESLMPYCYFPLQRLGVVDRLKRSRYPRKYSVQFVRATGEVSQPFYFFRHFRHEAATTWQVLRGEFDRMLLDNARHAGVEIREGCTATDLLREGGRVTGVRFTGAGGRNGEARAPVTIDASGRTALAQRCLGWKRWDPGLNKVAIWTYYRGALRDPGLDEGATTVAYLPQRAWFWYIPLPEDTVSVGLVADRRDLFRATRDPSAIFAAQAGRNEWIRRHLEPGCRCTGFRVTQEFSYRSGHCADDGLVLAGDAFAFLDPVFSSGVFLALTGGVLAGDAVHEALGRGDVSAGAFAGYGETLGRGLEAMRKLVYAFYDPGFSMGRLIRSRPHLRGDLTDLLIGDLFRDFTELFEAIGEQAKLPEPVPHGRPRVAAPA